MTSKLFAGETEHAVITSASLEKHRSELRAHCYRMLGSLHDADDVMQEVMARAWSAQATFREQSSLRTWLYQIATNVCLDELRRAHRRRELPVGAGIQITGDDATPKAGELARWIGPFPDALLVESDPEAKYLAAEDIRLAFIAALQNLTPQQRAVLLLRDVLGWQASEVAEALEMSVSAVNSALHRARALTEKNRGRAAPAELSLADQELLERYVRAWIAGDAETVAALLSDGVTFSMPPNPAWLRGKRDVARYLERVVLAPPHVSRRFVSTRANGAAAFGVYLRSGETSDPHRPHAIQVVTVAGGKIDEIVSFHDPSLFSSFALPAELD